MIKRFERQIKFMLCGAFNSIVQMSIFHLCYGVFNINLIISYTIAFFISTISGYTLNSRFTFNDRQKSLSVYLKYIFLVFLTFLLGEVLIYCFVDIFKIYHIISNVMVIVMIYPINYIISSNIIWNEKVA